MYVCNFLFYFMCANMFFCCFCKSSEIVKQQELISNFLFQRGWSLSPDGYYSFTSQQQRTEEVTIPSTELAQQVIEYARQLEMIV